MVVAERLARAGMRTLVCEEHQEIGDPVHCTGVLAVESFEELEQLLQEMPLVPLWQLDPLAALSENLEVVPFDPLLVFTDVDRWSVVQRR